jgi:hypothetical protein
MGKTYQIDNNIYQKAIKFTKRQLNTPNGLKIPNGHKIYQKAIKYTNTPNGLKIPNGHKIYGNILLQGLLKYTKKRKFWFENIPSGNPAQPACLLHIKLATKV